MEKLIIFAIIVIFSAIGKLIQKFNEQKEQESIRNLRELQPAKQRAQSELEAFLTRRDVVPESEIEVLSDGDFQPAGRPASSPPRPVAPAPAHRPLPTEQRREQNRQKNPQQKQPKQNQSRQQQPQQQTRRNQKSPQQKPSKQPQAVQQQSRRPSGDGVRQHVEQHMTHLDTLVDDHVQSDIVDSVNSHLGAFGVPDDTGRSKGAAAAAIVSALRSPNGVRQAILINEVLSRPRVLRR